MTEPLVSVVVPAYNPGDLLRHAIDSIVEQTFESWELAVVDDGSDEDLGWVEQTDARVRLLRTNHLGASMARNVGIAATTGALVAFLDADDRWLSDKLALQIPHFDSDDVVLSHTAFDFVDATGARTSAGYGAPVDYLAMLGGNFGVLQSSAVVRRTALEALGGFNPLLWVQQDLDLFLKLARIGSCRYLDRVEVEYRQHEANLTVDYWRAAQELLLVLDLHETFARAANDEAALVAIKGGRRATRRTYSFQAIDAARLARMQARKSDALLDLSRSARLSPAAAAESAREFLRARTQMVMPIPKGRG
jgi:glycosyltransferase involved in cell wall biosynthesis